MPEFIRAAARAGVTEDERKHIVDTVAADPQGGIALGGGLHKRRIAGRGKGESGGYRVVTVYVTENVPVFLVGLLSKGSADNFGKAELAAMASAAQVVRS